MRLGVIGNLITHSRLEYESAAVLKFGMQLAFQTQQDMPLHAPMIGQIAGRVFDHAHPQIAEAAGAPERYAGFALMLGALDLIPVGCTK